jgi:hypothetical protein
MADKTVRVTIPDRPEVKALLADSGLDIHERRQPTAG